MPIYGQGYILDKNLIAEMDNESLNRDEQTKYNFTNIWVKEANGSTLVRDCWPGPSHWVDFLNE